MSEQEDTGVGRVLISYNEQGYLDPTECPECGEEYIVPETADVCCKIFGDRDV